MTAYLAGFSLGFSLILAIGSQNAFVLKRGLRNQHLLVVCALCAVSDAILITIGVAGFGVIVNRFPVIELAARYGGALFLCCYAWLSFRSALTSTNAIDTQADRQQPLLRTVTTCLAFTWLNPHVYLDTLVLLGSISTQYQPYEWRFAAGATTASFVFFFGLGYGARALAPLFAKPVAWRMLEFAIGLTMLFIAISLVY